MILFQPFFLRDANEANTYIIGCATTKQAILIDAGGDTPEYDEFLRETGASLTGIFLTHRHWDHDAAVGEIVARHNVPVFSLPGNTRNGRAIAEGGSIPLGNLKTRVFQTTGHTPDSLTLVVENRFAFVGDALFAGSIGGTSGPSAQREEITNIRTKIFTLPDDALICPGHGPMSTVGIEKNWNPFFL
jgi:glyoxylase-like metal-dependent hydrolase (beta-lactamase superfamily II)